MSGTVKDTVKRHYFGSAETDGLEVHNALHVNVTGHAEIFAAEVELLLVYGRREFHHILLIANQIRILGCAFSLKYLRINGYQAAALEVA